MRILRTHAEIISYFRGNVKRKYIILQIKDFSYVENGNIFSLEYNGNTYYYVRNILGEIIGLVDTSGNYVVKYTCDAWGNVLQTEDGAGNDVSENSSHIANINLFRYKGYYYDIETGYYYLQTRYYDPELSRFINADGVVTSSGSAFGTNMFAYCNNDPVMLKDSTGLKPCFAYEEDIKKSTKEKHDKEFGTPGVVIYKVPCYDQGGEPLCWAYCQAMVESYYKGYSYDEPADRARKIAKDKYGDKWKEGGWPSNMLNNAYFPETIEDLYSFMLEYPGPEYVAYLGENGEDNHLVVLIGVNTQTNQVYTNNPWWGYTSIQSFEEFMSGYTSNLNGDPAKSVFYGLYSVDKNKR